MSYVGTGAGTQAFMFWIEVSLQPLTVDLFKGKVPLAESRLGCAIRLTWHWIVLFQDGGLEDNEKNFYESEEEEEEKEKSSRKKSYAMDPDHRLLIRNTKPLLQSRNAAVRGGLKELFHRLKNRPKLVSALSVSVEGSHSRHVCGHLEGCGV